MLCSYAVHNTINDAFVAILAPLQEGGFTPLFAAAEQAQLETMKLLLAAGADPNARDYRKATPLFIACVSNHVDIVKELCLRKHVVLSYAGVAGGVTPLYIASELGHTAVVRELLAATIPVKKVDVNQPTKFGALPIHAAAENGHVEVVKLLLAAGSPRNPFVIGPRKWLTAVYLAAQNDRYDVISALLWWQPGDDEKMAAMNSKGGNNNSASAPARPTSGVSATKAALAGASFVKVGSPRAAQSAAAAGVADAPSPSGSPAATSLSPKKPVGKAGGSGLTKKSQLLLAVAAAQDASAAGTLKAGEEPSVAGPAGVEDLASGVPPRLPDAVRQIPRKYLEKPLFVACRKGNLKSVAVLLDAGVNPDCIREDNRATPLFTASLYGHADVMSALVLAGADPNRPDKAGLSPILKAVKSGNAFVIRFLVGAGAVLSDANPLNGRLPLHEAAEIGNTEVITALLEMNARVNAQDNDGKTPLAIAVLHDNVVCSELLLERGADPLLTDKYGLSPLYAAARNGCEGIVRTVLRSKAVAGNMEYINRRNREDGSTPMFAAARAGSEGCVRALIEVGADVNATDNNDETPLMIASKLGHAAVVFALLRAEANVICITPKEKYTALHYAASGGYDDIVHALIMAHAPKDMTTTSGNLTPLLLAMMSSRTSTINLLLDMGANAAIPDVAGMTTLHFAIQLGDMELLDRLLHVPSVTAAINAVKRPERASALFLAAELGAEDAVHRLLELPDSGLDIELRNVVQATPLFIAAQEGHTAIVQMLMKAGANPNVVAMPPENIFPLFAASTTGHASTAQALILGGAELNKTTAAGATAFHGACAEGHLSVAVVLLRAGIDYHVRAIDGKTGLEVARKFGHNGYVSNLKPLIRALEREVHEAADRKERERLRQENAVAFAANEDFQDE